MVKMSAIIIISASYGIKHKGFPPGMPKPAPRFYRFATKRTGANIRNPAITA